MVVITSCALAPYRVKKFPCCALIVTVSWKLVPLWDIHIPGLEIGQWLCLLYLFCLYTVGIEFLWVGVVANLGMTKWIWILNRPLLPHGTGNFDFFVNLGILTVMCRNVVDVLVDYLQWPCRLLLFIFSFSLSFYDLRVCFIWNFRTNATRETAINVTGWLLSCESWFLLLWRTQLLLC